MAPARHNASMLLDLDGNGPLYLQLSRAIRDGVHNGRIPPGMRLPATRELAQEMGLSRNTVRAAYDHLGSDGFLAGRVGSGSYVSGTQHTTAPVPSETSVPPQSRFAQRAREIVDLHIGRDHRDLRYNLQYGEPFTDALLPDMWRKELARAAVYTDLGYPQTRGLEALRHAVCDYLRRRRGFVAHPDNVLITAGTQQAMSLAARVLLDEGDTVAIEDPGYFGARQVFGTHGARLLPIAVDKAGLVVEQLPSKRPGLIYVTPSHQFPLGVVMSQRRRQELLRYASSLDTWIMEDDYDAEIRFDTRQVASLRAMDREERVICVGSFSKVLAPSLRLAYMVVPPALRQDFINAKRMDDLGCPAIEQAALAHLMQSGGFERHLRRVVRALRARREALLAGIRQHGAGLLKVEDSFAGMHLVAWMPGQPLGMQNALIDAARKLGLGIYPLAPHYMRPPRRPGLLFGFAAMSTTEIDAACRLLGRARGIVSPGRLAATP